MSKKKFNRYSVRDMLNEAKASKYLPGLYVTYNYENDEDKDRKDLSISDWYNSITKRSEFETADNITFSTRIISLPAAEELEYDFKSTKRGKTKIKKKKITKALQQVLELVEDILQDDPKKSDDDQKKIRQIVIDIFDSYGAGKNRGIRLRCAAAFQSATAKDILWIGSKDSFRDVEPPDTAFKEELYRIAGGTQPAVGVGEIYFAMAVGGKQGSDKGGPNTPATDVINVNGKETLNNKEVASGAQGATEPDKFVEAVNGILEELQVQTAWPDFYKFIADELKMVDPGGFKGLKKLDPQVLAELFFENVSKYPTFQNPKALTQYILPFVAGLFHAGTTAELISKSNKGKAAGYTHFVTVQTKGSQFKVVECKPNHVSLPVHGKSGRVSYKVSGFFNFVGDYESEINFKLPTNLEELKETPADRSTIKIPKSAFGPFKVGTRLTPFKPPRNEEQESKHSKRIEAMKKILKTAGVNVDMLTIDVIEKAMEVAGAPGKDVEDADMKTFDAEEYTIWRNRLPDADKMHCPELVDDVEIKADLVQAEITETKLYKLSLLEALDLK